MKNDEWVWIPKTLWLTDDLSWTEKILFVEIDNLCQNDECSVSNAYLGKLFNLKKDTVSKVISSLKNKGYIEINLEYKEGTKRILKRVISTLPYRKKIITEICPV